VCVFVCLLWHFNVASFLVRGEGKGVLPAAAWQILLFV